MDLPGYDSWKTTPPYEDHGATCPACDGDGCTYCNHAGVMDSEEARQLAEHLDDAAIEAHELELDAERTLSAYGELPDCEVRGLPR